MTASPQLGIFYHLLGALAACAFYVPLKMIRQWRWETGWLVNGFASWVLMPSLLALCLLPDFVSFYRQVAGAVLLKTFLLGALWGVGGLTFGMTIRYLGMAIGYGLAIGITLVVGTLAPPLLKGDVSALVSSLGGRAAASGVALALLGIVLTSIAAMGKDKQQGGSTAEFRLAKGIIVAVVCGVLSAFMALAIEAAAPMQELALKGGVDPLYQIVPSYVVIMLGGFATNAAYCVYRLLRSAPDTTLVLPRQAVVNSALALAAGAIWYLQFFFYGWGHVHMVASQLGYLSWTLHMSLLVLGGGVFGLVLREWRGCSVKVIGVQVLGLATLIFSTVVIGTAASH